MQVLVWSNLDYVIRLCASNSSICPPGRQARSGRLGMDLLELELIWSSRAHTGGTGEGEAWDQKRNPDWRHDPSDHAVGEWVGQPAL